MRFRCLAVLLLPLLLPLSSCQNGAGSSGTAMSASALKKTYNKKRSNPFQIQKKSWLRDKTDRLGLTKDKPVTQAVGETTTEVFRSNQ
ncbi:MAG: hypothetical protein JWO82_2283 [Akkermansiaceae bacterium]|nr:hypothetical protein [Akkermansiaceae bacterium]